MERFTEQQLEIDQCGFNSSLNIRAWIKAGTCCLGMGSKLITKSAIAAGDFASNQEKVRQVLGWIATARR